MTFIYEAKYPRSNYFYINLFDLILFKIERIIFVMSKQKQYFFLNNFKIALQRLRLGLLYSHHANLNYAGRFENWELS